MKKNFVNAKFVGNKDNLHDDISALGHIPSIQSGENVNADDFVGIPNISVDENNSEDIGNLVKLPSNFENARTKYGETIQIKSSPIQQDCQEGHCDVFEKIQEASFPVQQQILEKTIATTAVSASVSYAFRRAYLDECHVIAVDRFSYSGYASNEISWLKLSSVGIAQNFGAKEGSLALEYIIHAFYAPGKYRFLFLASSDGSETAIHIGLQSLVCDGIGNNAIDDNVLNAINRYAENVWPGLQMELDRGFKCPIEDIVSVKNEKKISNGYVSYKNTRMRAFSGIPAFRQRDGKSNDATVNNCIDKLAESLYGKKWTYLIIADPIPTKDVENYQSICRDFAGRLESFKKMTISDGISRSVTESTGLNISESDSVPVNQFKNFVQGSGVGLTVGIGASAAIAAFCPVLLPFAPKIIVGAAGLGAMLGRGGTHSTTKGTTETKSTSTSHTQNVGQEIVNKHAEAVAKLLDDQVIRYQKCESLGAWSVGAYLVGEDEITADVGANVIRSLTSGDNSHFEPIRSFCLESENGIYEEMKDPIAALTRCMSPHTHFDLSGTKIFHPLGERFDELKMVINSRELTQFVNIPLSNIPGIPVRRISPDTGLCKTSTANGVEIGKQMFRGRIINSMQYCISRKSLSKHALIAGINGSGKTNTILGILNRLLEGNTPFLVIEPAKQEYVAWAQAKNNEILKIHNNNLEIAQNDPSWINVYIPGREKWGNLPLARLELNPFDFVWLNKDEQPKTAEHIDRLKTVVNAALPMYEILPVLMEELIYSAYSVKHAPSRNAGKFPTWLPNNADERYPEFDENIHIPSFQELRMLIPKLFIKHNYAQEIARNLRAALETRIDSFKRGWRKDLLNKDNPRKSATDWERLFRKPTVINLTSLTSDDDKAFFMSIILLFIYEFNQEKSEFGETNKAEDLLHLLIIEEAHRILGKCDSTTAYSAAPKQKVSEMFSNMISEVRAYGQGIMIADQIPCRLNEDAIKNTNLKIVHKLVSTDDRLAMSAALNLHEDQTRIIGDLDVGEALVRNDMDKDAYMVKINRNK